jgi:uncharacterized membrane protein
MIVFGLIGANALFLTYAWLLSAIIGSTLSKAKGYGERPGLASGLLLHVVGVIVWLVWPAKPESAWNLGDTPRAKLGLKRRVKRSDTK